MTDLKRYLYQPIPNIQITLFRWCLAIVLLIQSVFFISQGFVEQNIVAPMMLFPFFSKLTPLSENILVAISYIMLISNIGMLFNKYARISTIIFCACFSYFWILDKGYFNNHYYFISIMCFLLALVEERSSFKELILTPRFKIISLQLMVFIIYFISGINKLNPYWLFDLQPITHILEFKSEITGDYFYNNKLLVLLLTYCGLAFDLLIGFLLFNKHTRWLAFSMVIIFNFCNYFLFIDVGEIGVFPFIMITTLILFFDTHLLNKLINKRFKTSNRPNINLKKHPILFNFIVIFIIIQLLIPFRHFLFKGYVDYNGVGQRFSWRMKLMYKESNIQYYITDQSTNQKYEVNVKKMLTTKQYNNLMYYPDLIVPLAKKIKQEAQDKFNIKSPKITCEYDIQFMGKSRPQKLFSPEIDLAMIAENKLTHKWIYPLK
tara:strand:+ start:528 stop:1826 length:1299 start_codon:yes stop_codon:yes gene_type:complete